MDSKAIGFTPTMFVGAQIGLSVKVLCMCMYCMCVPKQCQTEGGADISGLTLAIECLLSLTVAQLDVSVCACVSLCVSVCVCLCVCV